MDSRASTDSRTSFLLSLLAGLVPVGLSLGFTTCASLLDGRSPRAAVVPQGAVAPAMVPQGAVPQPTVSSSADDFTFSVRPDRSAVLQGGDRVVRVELVIASSHAAGATREPTDLVVMLDTSGSMEGQKIRDARAAAAQLVRQLGPQDRLALVDFDSQARVVVPLTYATDGARDLALARIDALEAGGSTHMPQALDVGLAQFTGATRATRAILISDGRPNHPGDLEARARSAARSEHPLTAVGIGMDYDEALMSRLADLGTGNFYWVRERDDLARVFSEELQSASRTVASALDVTFTSPAGVEVVDAAGYARDGAPGGTSFRVGSLSAGQERRFWVTLQVPGGAGEEVDLGSFHLGVQGTAGRVDLVAGAGKVTQVSDREAWLASLDPAAWGRAVVEEEYNVMRTDVSRQVQAGQRDAALEAIRNFQARTGEMNAVAGSAEVARSLRESEALAGQVEATFQQEAAAQNSFAKGLNLTAYTSRRRGQSATW